MSCFSNLQDDFLSLQAFSVPVDVQKGRLVYKAASCLPGGSSSFLEVTPGQGHSRALAAARVLPSALGHFDQAQRQL